MEIEIVTTRKKLTKSILNQMHELDYDELEGAELLGYINNFDKYSTRILLLKIVSNEYRIAYPNWLRKTGVEELYRFIGTEKIVKPFFTVEDALKYHEDLMEMDKKAKQIYI